MFAIIVGAPIAIYEDIDEGNEEKMEEVNKRFVSINGKLGI